MVGSLIRPVRQLSNLPQLSRPLSSGTNSLWSRTSRPDEVPVRGPEEGDKDKTADKNMAPPNQDDRDNKEPAPDHPSRAVGGGIPKSSQPKQGSKAKK
ncbi:hypothetical protein WJX72_000159 [[Myrmecia] bisecta]|uniref:Uncharacterized protein n=1 Tax=[Myrmecia] bisecta TaxID=41462 RepID=A0AAW1PSU1_9CHLO